MNFGDSLINGQHLKERIMKHLVKMLIEENDIRRTPSIYVSIILAYLEMKKWDDAKYIIHVMQELEMRSEENIVYVYLARIINQQDEKELEDLWSYLNGQKVDSKSKNDIINTKT